jgi:hypothetical protein
MSLCSLCQYCLKVVLIVALCSNLTELIMYNQHEVLLTLLRNPLGLQSIVLQLGSETSFGYVRNVHVLRYKI